MRLEWVRTLADWLLHLRERIDHEPRLLPYVLSALTDKAPLVADEAVRALDALGRAHEQEHAKELAEVTAYLPQEAHALGWAEALQQPARAAAPLSLPAPGERLSVAGRCLARCPGARAVKDDVRQWRVRRACRLVGLARR